ncbi:hypothetical protein D3C84_1295190 [compost metagenome]
MAPAADPVLIRLGQQIVDGVHPLRIDLAQRRFGKVITGVEEGEGFATFAFGGWGPAKVFFVIAV